MFLTKKSFRKILIMAICYLTLGVLNIALAIFFENLGIESTLLLWLGSICLVLCIFFAFWGRYAEGKGKLINLGNRLVRKELKPAEFIKEYEALKNSQDLVIKKPDFEILHLVATAYASLDDMENELATVQEMISISGEKKKNFAKLLKVACLFSYREKEAAEKLFNEICQVKLDVMSNTLAQIIHKTDRAIAFEDYKTAKEYWLKTLERKLPKLDKLGELIAHYNLGEIYEKQQDNEKAASHYRYCVNFGGETAIKLSAKEKLNSLK